MTTETAPNSLREQLSATFDAVTAEAPAEAPATPEAEEAQTQVEAKPETPTEGRTAGRPRDEKGRLLPGKAEKAPAPAEAAAPAIEAPKPAKPRPDSWKKEYWEHWDKIDPKLQEYLHEREGDFRKGVGTYKAEYDRLKPLGEAVNQYLPLWQQAGVNPDQAIRNLAETDRILRQGSKEDKLRLLAYMAQSYNVPMNEMLVRGEDGNVYFNQQYLTQQQPQQQPAVSPQEIQAHIESAMAAAAWRQKVADFRSAKDASGSPLYPHVAEVEETMAGLLRSGVIPDKDLPSAYQAALRMPQHAALFDAAQQQQAHAKAQAEAKAKADAAARARAGAVSVKSQSPTGTAQGEKTRKGLRDTIAEAFDAAESSRI